MKLLAPGLVRHVANGRLVGGAPLTLFLAAHPLRSRFEGYPWTEGVSAQWRKRR